MLLKFFFQERINSRPLESFSISEELNDTPANNLKLQKAEI